MKPDPRWRQLRTWLRDEFNYWSAGSKDPVDAQTKAMYVAKAVQCKRTLGEMDRLARQRPPKRRQK